MRTSLRAETIGGVRLLRYLVVFATALLLVAGLTMPPAHAQQNDQPTTTASEADTSATTATAEPEVGEQAATSQSESQNAEPESPAKAERADIAPATPAAVVIDDITIVNDRTSTSQNEALIQWQHLTVQWSWHATGDVLEGQTFSIEFPEQLNLSHDEEFYLSSGSEPPHPDNGICRATARPTPSKVVCTIGKNFAEKDDVHGKLSIRAQAVQAWDGEHVVFNVNNGEQKSVRLPGPKGTITGQIDEAPKYPVKWGWYNADQQTVTWRIHIPGDKAAALGASPMVINDVLSGHGHVYVDNSWRAGEYEIIGTITPDVDRRTREPKEVLNVAVDITDGTKAKVTVNPPKDGWNKDRYYLVEYRTKTADGKEAPFAAVTNNLAEIDSIGTLKRSVSRSQTGQGTIEGVDRRSVEVHKKLAQDSAPVPAGTVFSVLAEYNFNGQDVKERIEVPLDGSAKGKQELPRGTKIILSEPTFPQVAGLTFEQPKFAPVTAGDANVKILQDGAKAEVTTVSDANVQVVVENKAVTNKASFTVAKKIAGLNDEWMDIARTKEYTFNYKCGEHGTGTLKVKGDGEAVAVDKSFPVGTECTVTEDRATAEIDGAELTTDESAMTQTLKLGPEAGAVAEFQFTNTYKGGALPSKPWWLLLLPFALGAAGSSGSSASGSAAGSSQSAGTNQPGGNDTARQAPAAAAQDAPAQRGDKGAQATLANTGASVLAVIAIAAIAVAAGVFLIRRGRRGN